MPASRTTPRILAKVVSAHAVLGASASNLPFVVEPLFASIGKQPGHAMVAGSQWCILTPKADALAAKNQNTWDMCHQLVKDGLGLTGGPAVEFAEPDLEQQWLHSTAAEAAFTAAEAAFTAASGCKPQEPQDSRFPRGDEPLWFRDNNHSQFSDALSKLGDVDPAEAVRIAHCDTGYDRSHKSLPSRLSPENPVPLERNFVDEDRANNAADVSTGLINNFGHGTGTLGILAGNAVGTAIPVAYGAAPFVEIVPIRVANSVVLFRNSAIARAFDYIHSLCDARETRVHVVTMSMGGLASQAWAEAVNALYDTGVFVVTASGNNFGNLPTRNIVYPARFNRVVAACGVMENHAPDANLGLTVMAGNFGPPKKMRTAISACTPNVPWAKLGCSDIVDLDGQGTSSATPQVAAAAAIWIQKNKSTWEGYSQGWMRVESVRRALFSSGRPETNDLRLGCGELQAADALGVLPAAETELKPEDRDTVSFPLLRVLTGLGFAAGSSQQRMLELEALQLSQSAAIERLLPDPDVDPASVSRDQLAQLAAALAADPRTSNALRKALGKASDAPTVPMAPPAITNSAVETLHLARALEPQVPTPPCRRLRVYAYDPSLGTNLDTMGIAEATLEIQWEDPLEPGPAGEYLEVLDVDPASQCAYSPIDLNDPRLLVQDGLAPTESDPRFHQQMVYAVAMKTIEHFERALGRVALWAPRLEKDTRGQWTEEYIQRLRIYPHALRDSNAFYSPDRKALLFGYFFRCAPRINRERRWLSR